MIFDSIIMTATAVADSVATVSKSMNVSEAIETLSGLTLGELLHEVTGLAVTIVGRIIQLLLVYACQLSSVA